jgi:hypothetical protein
MFRLQNITTGSYKIKQKNEITTSKKLEAKILFRWFNALTPIIIPSYIE